MENNKRRAIRFRCQFRVSISIRGETYSGTLIDVSEAGMGLLTDRVASVWTGDRVEVDSPDLGLLVGTARWRTPKRVGVKLDESTNTSAKFHAMRKNLRLELT
jgi:hypothetical protein